MKFGEAFTEYLHNDRERYFLEKCSHVEYKRLKKVLKTCQTCKTLHDSDTAEQEEEEEETAVHQINGPVNVNLAPCVIRHSSQS
ncbi:hypothetical protein M0R45_030045 [Rubus argutus]|uniref:Recombination activating protein 1 n=1 Tax=Rubus argutus TaxID=59490 RepID=A0AAW1WDS6_RUBAR